MNEKMHQEPKEKVVIVGAVAGGASAAARARRLNEAAEIILFERGPDVSFANCGLPYHIGGEIKDRERLAVQTPDSLKAMLNVDVRVRHEVVAIDRANKQVEVRNLETGETSKTAYDKLILSPGAAPIRPPLPGIEDPRIMTLRNLQDMDRIKDQVASAKSVLVIGGGFIGLEVAEQVHHLNKEITLVELQEQVLPQMDVEMVKPVEESLLGMGVNLVLGDGIKSFESREDGLTAHLNSGRTVAADMVLLSIGVRPESSLAKAAGLELGPRGHIDVNEYMQTSDPAIYAVGDVVQVKDPILGGKTAIALGGPANRQGRVAADHIFLKEKARSYPGSIGTSIVRVFDVEAGTTGANSARLKREGVAFEVTTVTDFHHASYYPGAQDLTLRILWSPEDGRILGGQACGPRGVDKRLDVLATAIKGGLGIEDLEHLELAYAPPFGSAKDPVNIAAFAALNRRDCLMDTVDELPTDPNVQVVDVRPAIMSEVSPLANSLTIPLNDLRASLNKLDATRPVVTVCAKGKMSYFAARILQQHGFDVKSLSGGLKVRSKSDTPVSGGSLPVNKGVVETSGESSEPSLKVDLEVDACGLACPGPVLRLKEAVDGADPNTVIRVKASDSGFLRDFKSFCNSAGHDLLSIGKEDGGIVGVMRKTEEAKLPVEGIGGARNNNSTLVVFSQEMDKVMAALIISLGAKAMGGEASLFFTFWGLNALRKDQLEKPVKKGFMDKMFGWMLPQGVNRLPLSNMDFMGAGRKMMKDRMKSKNLPNLPGLLEEARKQGVRMIACGMSMEAMGIQAEELIDGVEFGGVADFLASSNNSDTNLFI